MPDMNSTSASAYGSRPSPGGVGWRLAGGFVLQPSSNAATSSSPAIAARDTFVIANRIVSDSPPPLRPRPIAPRASVGPPEGGPHVLVIGLWGPASLSW